MEDYRKIAIELGQTLINKAPETREDVERMLPELAESEDERIRKALIEMVHDTTGDELWVDYNVHKEDALDWLEKQGERKTPQWMIDFLDNYRRKIGCSLDHDEARDVDGKILCIKDWLEKQGEQKPVWSEEDEKFVHGLIRGLTVKRDIHGHTTFSSDCIDITETIDWLKSFKDRVQPKQEWSDVDKNILSRIIDNLMFIRDTISIDPKYAVNIIDIERGITWLKSLRPQTTWKPSDEQMDALEKECIAHSNYELCRLLEQLKKLREE